MRAGFVDRLLARVDGELSPIFISQLITTDEPPDEASLARAVARLVAETGRLQLAFSRRAGDLVPRPRSDDEVRRAVRTVGAGSPTALVERLLDEGLDLERDLPLRVTLAPLDDARDGAHLLCIQLHHAFGDARSLMHLNRRLWQLLSGTETDRSRLGPARMHDGLAAALAGPHAALSLADPRNRVLARRGHALRRDGASPGPARLITLRASVGDRFSVERRSGLFFGALLFAVAAHEAGREAVGPIRLRVPIDLRRELRIGPTLENACSAVPVELDLATVRSLLGDAERLCALVPDQLSSLLAARVHHGALLECLLASRLATTDQLRRHIRPDLAADVRANTLVTTYVGSVDRYLADAPFPIRTMRTQTPTLGANGFSFRGDLVINMTAFEGLWSRATHEAFVASMRRFFEAELGVACEVQR